jgi:amino acid transporter
VADSTRAEVYPEQSAARNYGLHAGILGPVETLAQSVSAVAPTASPTLTIPLVFALAGNATWFVYLLATIAIFLVGFCVSRFARISVSPGSLYTYTSGTLPPACGALAAWALLLAYIATGASVAAGALYYGTTLVRQWAHWSPSAILVLAGVCAIAGYVAWRDVKLSAEVMLWVEAVSVSIILLVLGALVFHFGLRLDWDQLLLRGVTFPSLGPALVLAIFSFVGFESATSLGAEVRNPRHTIPRAVLLCALLIGAFFILCSYSEVLGFRSLSDKLSETTSPLHQLAGMAGVSPLGIAIDFGAMVSMFACVLACDTAASRLLMKMAHEGLVPRALERTNARHGTPGAAIALSTSLMFISTTVLTLCRVNALDIYDIAGSLSVFGFLTAYALTALALPFARRAAGQHSVVIAAVSTATVVVMLLIALFDLQSATDAVHGRLIPEIYLGYVVLGMLVYLFRRRASPAVPSRE